MYFQVVRCIRCIDIIENRNDAHVDPCVCLSFTHAVDYSSLLRKKSTANDQKPIDVSVSFPVFTDQCKLKHVWGGDTLGFGFTLKIVTGCTSSFLQRNR